MGGFVLKFYAAQIEDFPTVFVAASSRSKARYQLWLNYSEAYESSFAEFQKFRLSIWLSTPPPVFGEPIAVMGRLAFRAWDQSARHYVPFVWPGEDLVRYAHHSDVASADAVAERPYRRPGQPSPNICRVLPALSHKDSEWAAAEAIEHRRRTGLLITYGRAPQEALA